MCKPWKGCSSSDSAQIHAKVISAADQPGQHRLEADKWDWCKSFCSPLVRNRPERVRLRSIRDRKLCWAWDLFAECFCPFYVCVVRQFTRDCEMANSSYRMDYMPHMSHRPDAVMCQRAFRRSEVWDKFISLCITKHHQHNSAQITFGFDAGRQAYIDVKRQTPT